MFYNILLISNILYLTAIVVWAYANNIKHREMNQRKEAEAKRRVEAMISRCLAAVESTTFLSPADFDGIFDLPKGSGERVFCRYDFPKVKINGAQYVEISLLREYLNYNNFPEKNTSNICSRLPLRKKRKVQKNENKKAQ